MGARLVYAKVIDREVFYVNERGRLHPSLENRVVFDESRGVAGAFLVLRGWTDDHGSFTEQWRLRSPGGETLYESIPREIHLPTAGHIEKLEDEVADLDLPDGDGYHIAFELDEQEVARVRFDVRTANGE